MPSTLSKFLHDRQNQVMIINLIHQIISWRNRVFKQHDLLLQYGTNMRPVDPIATDLMKYLGGLNLALLVLSAGKLWMNWKWQKRVEQKEREVLDLPTMLRKQKKWYRREWPFRFDKLILLTFAVASLSHLWFHMRFVRQAQQSSISDPSLNILVWNSAQLKKMSIIEAIIALLNLLVLFYD